MKLHSDGGRLMPDPALQVLERLVGTWDLTGRTLDSPIENVCARVVFEWLPGGWFLQKRNELYLARREIWTVEIIRYDAQRETYPATAFTNVAPGPVPCEYAFQGDEVTIRTTLGGGATFVGRFADGGNAIAGGWQPDEGMEGPDNVAYDVYALRRRSQAGARDLVTVRG